MPGEVDVIAELWFDDRESMTRAMSTPEAKTLHADGALFIGRIKSFTVEEKVIIPRSDRPCAAPKRCCSSRTKRPCAR